MPGWQNLVTRTPGNLSCKRMAFGLLGFKSLPWRFSQRFDASCLQPEYMGIMKHPIQQVGGYDIVITAEEFNNKK